MTGSELREDSSPVEEDKAARTPRSNWQLAGFWSLTGSLGKRAAALVPTRLPGRLWPDDADLDQEEEQVSAALLLLSVGTWLEQSLSSCLSLAQVRVLTGVLQAPGASCRVCRTWRSWEEQTQGAVTCCPCTRARRRVWCWESSAGPLGTHGSAVNVFWCRHVSLRGLTDNRVGSRLSPLPASLS